ncbi:MAG: hypothetical protein ACRDKT_10790 [Actinomycetota bacterium]
MAIYKPPKARWPLAVFAGVVGLLVGVGVGLVVGREEPDASEGVRLVQQELASAAAGLEVAGIEYEEAVEDGEVLNDTEYQGSLDALDSSRTRFEGVEDALATLAPDQAEAIASGYDEAAGAMEGRAPPDEVQGLLDELSELLKGDST